MADRLKWPAASAVVSSLSLLRYSTVRLTTRAGGWFAFEQQSGFNLGKNTGLARIENRHYEQVHC
jgi:hypothetical protein